MTCAGCANSVERTLRALDEDAEVHVNLTTGLVAITTRSDRITEARAAEVVQALGYTIEFATDMAPLGADNGRPAPDARRLYYAIGLAMPVLVLEYVPAWLGAALDTALTAWRIAQLVLCAALLISPAGWAILSGGWRAIMSRVANMDLLVSLGVTVAFVASLTSLVAGRSIGWHLHAAAMIVGFITIGRHLEARARGQASQAVALLARRMPTTADCRRDGRWVSIPVESVELGETVRVAEHTTVPVDGEVVDGTTAIDESVITGESVPRTRRPGGLVRAGSMVLEGVITLKATAVGADSTLGRIRRAVEEAQGGKTHLQRLADRVAGVFVPIVTGLAVLTFLGWWLLGGPTGQLGSLAWALRCAVAVLVIACPCAMGLATPVAVLVATGAAALNGILVRDSAALESAGQVTTVVLDKTGTLTAGRLEVKDVVDDATGPLRNEPREVLRWAASAEQLSQHPLARAIVAKAREWDLELTDCRNYHPDPGHGVAARIDDHQVLVGSEAFLAKHNVNSANARPRADLLTADGRTVVLVALDGECVGVLGLGDTLRPGAGQAVEQLKRLATEVIMLTGDRLPTAVAVAGAVGIQHVHAEQLPEQKLAELERLRSEGKRIAFVGDGVNDAPALAAADVGLTFATGTDVAVESADITLLGDDLRAIPQVIELARRSVRIIKQNLFWAFAYNLLALPLAAWGKVPPGAAAAAMMLSSISVVLNSLRLRGAAGAPEPAAD